MSSSDEESTDLDFTERKETAALWALVALPFLLYGLGMYTALRKSPKTLLFAEVLSRVPSLAIAFEDIRTEYPIVAALQDESSQRAASVLMVLTTVLCARVFAVAWKDFWASRDYTSLWRLLVCFTILISSLNLIVLLFEATRDRELRIFGERAGSMARKSVVSRSFEVASHIFISSVSPALGQNGELYDLVKTVRGVLQETLASRNLAALLSLTAFLKPSVFGALQIFCGAEDSPWQRDADDELKDIFGQSERRPSAVEILQEAEAVFQKRSASLDIDLLRQLAALSSKTTGRRKEEYNAAARAIWLQANGRRLHVYKQSLSSEEQTRRLFFRVARLYEITAASAIGMQRFFYVARKKRPSGGHQALSVTAPAQDARAADEQRAQSPPIASEAPRLTGKTVRTRSSTPGPPTKRAPEPVLQGEKKTLSEIRRDDLERNPTE
jgi:hypothetical protein